MYAPDSFAASISSQAYQIPESSSYQADFRDLYADKNWLNIVKSILAPPLHSSESQGDDHLISVYIDGLFSSLSSVTTHSPMPNLPASLRDIYSL